jgi:hypothetical protein
LVHKKGLKVGAPIIKISLVLDGFAWILARNELETMLLRSHRSGPFLPPIGASCVAIRRSNACFEIVRKRVASGFDVDIGMIKARTGGAAACATEDLRRIAPSSSQGAGDT